MRAVHVFLIGVLLAKTVHSQDSVGSGDIIEDKDSIRPCTLERLFLNGDRTSERRRLSGGETVARDKSVSYVCQEGFELSANGLLLDSPFVRVCVRPNDQGRQLVFDVPPPTCDPISCPAPAIPANGGRQGNSFQFEDVVTFTCDDGYALRGSVRRQCRADGTFSGTPVTCTAQSCTDPGQVSFADRDLAGLRIGNTVRYICNPGYELRGQQELTCEPTLQWSHPLPSCEPRSCCQLEAPRNGGMRGDSLSFGSDIFFTCNEGFQLLGSETRECLPTGTWSGTQPQCQPIMCPVPRQIANGGFTGNGFGVGDRLSFYCNNGFHLAGAPELVCRRSGIWDRPLPSCMVVNCGNPGMPENGGRNGDNFTYTAHATFSCNDGYRLFGSPVRFCLADGTWSGEPASCNLATCGDPGTPVDGSRTLSGTTNGDTVDWQCNSGFQLVGGSNAVCQPNGRWSRPTPVCSRIMCLEPSAPVNGNKFGEDYNVGSTVAFTCLRGFRVQGPESIDCLAAGRWTQPPPVCIPLRCADPGVPDNGYRQIGGFTLGTKTDFFCNPGYQLIGPSGRTCLEASGGVSALRWDASVPRCVPVNCGDPGMPVNGSRQGNDFSFMSTVGFMCDEGFVLRGAISLLCLPTGQWSQPIPSCEPIRCPTPASVENGRIVSFGQMFMDTAIWECNSGFVLQGRPSAMCQATGRWSNPPPTCVRGACNDPGNPVNGYRFMASASVGSTVEYYCNPGFSLNGPEERLCQVDGTWDRRVPTCDPISCRDPGAPVNGAASGDDFSFASTVTFTCNTGYRLSGRDLITCLATGAWSHPLPVCQQIDCGAPGNTINGQSRYTATTHNSVANFVCDTGYEREGPDRAVCQLNGQWSARPPICRKIICPDPGTPVNGGRTLTGLDYQDTVDFTCNTGYLMRNTPDATVTCLANGVWSHPLPSCEPITCPDPGAPLRGEVVTQSGQTPDQYVYRDSVSWRCEVGHMLVGSPSATCQADGTWSSNTPICRPVNCVEPVAPVNGRKTVLGLSLGDRVQFTCDAGFNLLGEEEIVCLPSGGWSDPVPLCTPVECDLVRGPSNGDMNMTNNQFLGEASFSCFAGFELVGTPKVTCMETGEWSAPPPVCEEVFCQDPGIPEKGQRLTSDFGVGGMLTYQCDVGFTMNGSPKLTCKSDQTFDVPVPTCDPDCLLGDWSDWGACSVTCGPGQQTRTRPVIQAPSGNGKACDPQSQTQSCNPRNCVICESAYNLGDLVYRVQQKSLVPVTDVLIVVDESKSMALEHAWLPGMISALERILNEAGIGRPAPAPRTQRNLYGLVGFGKRAPAFLAHRFSSSCGRPSEYLFPIECYRSANNQLEDDDLGSIEDGYEAMNFALDQIPFRTGPGIAHNMIFVSDEDRDVRTSVTRAGIKARLLSLGFVLNVVIDNQFFGNRREDLLLGVDNRNTGYRSDGSGGFQEVRLPTIGAGYASTKNDYTDLALELSGAAWDINILRSGRESSSFTNAFTQVKTSEIQRQTDRCSNCECLVSATADGGGQFQCVESSDQEECRCKSLEGTFVPSTKECQNPLAVPQDCTISAWTPYGACSVTCGTGLASRSRTVIAKPLAGGASCPNLDQNRLCVGPPCEGSGCINPGTPENGGARLVGAQGFPAQPGALMEFTCGDGYDLEGSPFAICQASQTWSTPMPTCTRRCIQNALSYRVQKRSQNVATDVVMVVDQSRSMGTEIEWLKQIIPQLNRELLKFSVGTDSGCPNMFSLVGFGRASPDERAKFFTPASGANLFPIGEYADAVFTLREDDNGRIEDGYQAMRYALQNVPFRTSSSTCNISRNMLLLTDEDRDVTAGSEGLNRPVMEAFLRQLGVKLNAIVDNTFTVNGVRGVGRSSSVGYGLPSAGGCYSSARSVQSGAGYGNTKNLYTDLAMAVGGAAWDILQLRSTANRESVTCAIIDIKVGEIASDVVDCQVCTCDANGAETCTTASSAALNQCLCRFEKRVWNNGACLPDSSK